MSHCLCQDPTGVCNYIWFFVKTFTLSVPQCLLNCLHMSAGVCVCEIFLNNVKLYFRLCPCPCRCHGVQFVMGHRQAQHCVCVHMVLWHSLSSVHIGLGLCPPTTPSSSVNTINTHLSSDHHSLDQFKETHQTTSHSAGGQSHCPGVQLLPQ